MTSEGCPPGPLLSPPPCSVFCLQISITVYSKVQCVLWAWVRRAWCQQVTWSPCWPCRGWCWLPDTMAARSMGRKGFPQVRPVRYLASPGHHLGV